MNGRDKCEMLREMRRQIAYANGIPYQTTECPYSDCSGRCPKTDGEVTYLNAMITEKAEAGETVMLGVLHRHNAMYYGEEGEPEYFTGRMPAVEEPSPVQEEPPVPAEAEPEEVQESVPAVYGGEADYAEAPQDYAEAPQEYAAEPAEEHWEEPAPYAEAPAPEPEAEPAVQDDSTFYAAPEEPAEAYPGDYHAEEYPAEEYAAEEYAPEEPQLSPRERKRLEEMERERRRSPEPAAPERCQRRPSLFGRLFGKKRADEGYYDDEPEPAPAAPAYAPAAPRTEAPRTEAPRTVREAPGKQGRRRMPREDYVPSYGTPYAVEQPEGEPVFAEEESPTRIMQVLPKVRPDVRIEAEGTAQAPQAPQVSPEEPKPEAPATSVPAAEPAAVEAAAAVAAEPAASPVEKKEEAPAEAPVEKPAEKAEAEAKEKTEPAKEAVAPEPAPETPAKKADTSTTDRFFGTGDFVYMKSLDEKFGLGAIDIGDTGNTGAERKTSGFSFSQLDPDWDRRNAQSRPAGRSIIEERRSREQSFMQSADYYDGSKEEQKTFFMNFDLSKMPEQPAPAPEPAPAEEEPGKDTIFSDTDLLWLRRRLGGDDAQDHPQE